MTCKKLTENYCCEWKLTTVVPQERSTWKSGIRSAMRSASQIPERGPTDVDDDYDYDDMMSTSHKKALLTRKTYVKYQRSKSSCQRLLKHRTSTGPTGKHIILMCPHYIHWQSLQKA